MCIFEPALAARVHASGPCFFGGKTGWCVRESAQSSFLAADRHNESPRRRCGARFSRWRLDVQGPAWHTHTHVWALSDAAEAFRFAEERPSGFIKSIVCP